MPVGLSMENRRDGVVILSPLGSQRGFKQENKQDSQEAEYRPNFYTPTLQNIVQSSRFKAQEAGYFLHSHTPKYSSKLKVQSSRGGLFSTLPHSKI